MHEKRGVTGRCADDLATRPVGIAPGALEG
jgi:hypothetical protein